MKRVNWIIALLCVCTPSAAQSIGPFVGSNNFSYDLRGEPDARPSTWGTAAWQSNTVTFQPPDGYRVRVLSITGTLDARFSTMGTQPIWVSPFEPRFAGVLGAIATELPDAASGSVRADWLADRTFWYGQDNLSTLLGTVRVPVATPRYFHRAVNNVLEPDHKLHYIVASWLNETDYEIHAELTTTVVYEFVPE